MGKRTDIDNKLSSAMFEFRCIERAAEYLLTEFKHYYENTEKLFNQLTPEDMGEVEDAASRIHELLTKANQLNTEIRGITGYIIGDH